MQSQVSEPTVSSASPTDISALAWVADEVAKSLDSSGKALKRYLKDTEAARGTDLASVDDGQLRLARQHIHQAVGALEMVGYGHAAMLLKGMEAAVQLFVNQPERCTQDAVKTVERAGFALTEYLNQVITGRVASPLSLFPQYRDVQTLAGADRIHPADLWPHDWRWADVELPTDGDQLDYAPAVRKRMDQEVLRVMKTGSARASAALSEVCQSLARGDADRLNQRFWSISAGFFDALAQRLVPADLYVKRAASRVLLQFATLSKGNAGVSERLAHDLLFFCMQAGHVSAAQLPMLAAVRKAYRLGKFQPVDYDKARFGQFDPALLVQGRKRIESLKETWSAFAAGEIKRARAAADQLGLVADSLAEIFPPAARLVDELRAVQGQTASATTAPEAEMAMEVATAVLFLEATFDDFDMDDPRLLGRSEELAERLKAVRAGGHAKPIAAWMEELYRRVSDRQTMGTVVGELRANLNEVEGHLDQFFRDTSNTAELASVPGLLGQMRGVLAVLGVSQAAQAVDHMRHVVEGYVLVIEERKAEGLDTAEALPAAQLESLGNSMGVLGLMIDMLNYQHALAKKLFVFDADAGELRLIMGREAQADAAEGLPPEDEVQPQALSLPKSDAGVTPEQLEALASHAALADQPELAASAKQAAQAAAGSDPQALAQALEKVEQLTQAQAIAPSVSIAPLEDIEDADLKEIFLEEAREVVGHGQAAVQALVSAPSDVELLSDLRRAFHTLKGSSRMVGLNEFGEAAWSMEQLLNVWRAEQRPANPEMRELCQQTLAGLGAWVEDIAVSQQAGWHAAPFREAADALRNEGRYAPLDVTSLKAAPAVPSLPEAAEAGLADLDAGAQSQAAEEPEVIELTTAESIELGEPEAAPEAAEAQAIEAIELDGALTLGDSLDDLSSELPAEAAQPVEDISFDLDLASAASIQEAEPKGAQQADLSADSRVETPSTSAPAPSLDLSALSLPSLELAPVIAAGTVPVAEHELIELEVDDSVLPDNTAVEYVPTQTSMAAPLPPLDLSHIDLPDLSLDLSEVKHSIEDEDSVHAEPEEPSALLDLDFAELRDLPSETQFGGEAIQRDIDGLKLSDALYNVYLGEAEVWSKDLEQAVFQLQYGFDERAYDMAIARAHSLAGSSGTVGFTAMSNLARAMEHALQRLHAHGDHSKVQIQTLLRGADQVVYLLRHFASGSLKEADPGTLTAIEALEPPQSARPVPEPEQAVAQDEPVIESIESIELTAAVEPELAEAVPAMDSVDVVELIDVTEEEHVQAVEAEEPAEPLVSTPLMPAPVPLMPEPAPESKLEIIEPVSPVRIHEGVISQQGLDLSQTPKAVTVSEASVAARDDFDVADAFDADLFPIFEEEATDLFPALASALREWVARPDDMGPRGQVLRALHTLKGSARLAGAMRLGELAHRMESDIEALGQDNLNAASVEPMLGELDNLQALFEQSQAAAVQGSVVVLDEPVAEVEVIDAAPMQAAEAPAPVNPEDIAEPAPLVLNNERAKSNQAVRVRSQLLDKLVNEAGEVTISRTRMENKLNQLRASVKDITGNLDRLRRQLRDMELQTETQMQSRMALSKDTAQNFDPLEFDRFTRVQEITRSMAESVDDISTLQRTLQRSVETVEDDLAAQAGMTRSLQQNLLRTRMMEFETLSERLYRVVRQASKESGKQVKLDIAGGTIEIDRSMLERMTPAFEHLLRNSVVHGIEEPTDRRAKGKEATGTITIVVTQTGNDVAVEIRDDGAGLNAAAIREKAIARGLITADHELTPAEVGQLIFAPGFSTVEHVTELAGRGVGMDVVRNEVQSLGGRIETRYAEDLGSSFKLVLPLTTAMTQVVMVRMGETVVGVPSSVVEIVRNLTRDELAAAYASGSYEYNKEKLSFYWGGALLQDSPRSMDTAEKGLPVVIFRSASQRIAVHVDEVAGNHEVVVKNLGTQLSRMPGLAAMTVLPEGDVALVYNPVALASVYGERARKMTVALNVPVNLPKAAQDAPALVLVVDDSITVRRVTQRFLQREGFRVELANDGLQALDKLRTERPTLVLSDIEMPRMDGFDLLRNIRHDPALKDLPVIMITSRIAEKHREHAQELGANHYLGKPYAEDALLTLVRQYAQEARERVA